MSGELKMYNLKKNTQFSVLKVFYKANVNDISMIIVYVKKIK